LFFCFSDLAGVDPMYQVHAFPKSRHCLLHLVDCLSALLVMYYLYELPVVHYDRNVYQYRGKATRYW
jgi:hypothetical protein